MQHAPCLASFTLAALALAQTARAQSPPQLVPLTASEVADVRPLAARGAVALVWNPDSGPQARTTLVVPLHAPLAAVHQAITDAPRWPEFIPAIRTVEELSRHGRRAAYRFTASASVLEASATCEIRDLSPRRVDYAVVQSDFGPAGSRWDLVSEGPEDTLVLVTSWSDPSQGHWLLRRTARTDPSATAGMTIAAELTLALSVGRRARTLSGHPTSVRPSRTWAPNANPEPPPVGPWLGLSRRYYVVAFTLDGDGAVTQVTATGQTSPGRERVLQRLDDVAHLPRHLGGLRAVRDAGEGRFEVELEGAWERGEGALRYRHEPGDTVYLQGASGDFAATRWRWDVRDDPGGGTVLMFTGGVDGDLANSMAHLATSREPYLAPGLTALRRLVWLRQMLAGL